LPAPVLATLTPAQRTALLGKEFFPHLISEPFMAALHTVFIFSACLCAIAAVASFLRGRQQLAQRTTRNSPANAKEAPANAEIYDQTLRRSLESLAD